MGGAVRLPPRAPRLAPHYSGGPRPGSKNLRARTQIFSELFFARSVALGVTMTTKLLTTKSLALLAVAAAALATAPLHAQSTAPASAGLLGTRYVEVGGSVTDLKGLSDHAFGADLGVNLPVATGFDLGFGYSYGRINADLGSGGFFQDRSRSHTLLATGTAYTTTTGNLKPFLSAGLGYAWTQDRLKYGGTPLLSLHDHQAVWGLAVGAEIPLARFTLTPRISYQDTFKDSNGVFAYGAELATWITKSFGLYADVAYLSPRRDPSTVTIASTTVYTAGSNTNDAWTYALGARFRF